MLQALARRSARHSAVTRIVPPPVGGWNTRDALDSMPQQDALTLDNWFPREQDVVVRKGYLAHSDTGEGVAIRGLVSHNRGTSSKLIAFCNGMAFDVSTDTPSTLATGLDVAAEVFGFNMKGVSFYLNGADAVQSYDGTTFGAATLGKDAADASGQTLTLTALTCGMAYKRRVYFGGDGSLGFWHGDVDEISGNILFYFPLDTVMGKGGYLVAMGALTDDGGSGRNDFACFISSEGQVAIFSGSDPTDATNWEIVGVYDIGEPVNRFGVVKYGADLVFITRSGYVPLSAVLSGALSKSDRYTLSDKISSEATDAVERYGSNAGWRIAAYPKSSMLIVNVPRTATTFDQHVMNTVTGAWCRFRGIAATDFAIHGTNCYFGSTDGVVYRFDIGNMDGENGISADAKTAWNYFSDAGRVKQFNLAQPIFVSNAAPLLQIGFAVDFRQHRDTGVVQAATATGSGVWDEAVWDTVTWAGSPNATRKWIGLSGVGYAGSLRVRAVDTEAEISWKSTRVLYQPGGPR
jgi:hypothetical protein